MLNNTEAVAIIQAKIQATGGPAAFSSKHTTSQNPTFAMFSPVAPNPANAQQKQPGLLSKMAHGGGCE